MAYGSTAQTPIGFDATPNSDIAAMLATGGTGWQVANLDALTATDSDPSEARWPYGIVTGASAITAHANCPLIRTTDARGKIRGLYVSLCVGWFAAAATTLTGDPRVAVLGDCSGDSPESAALPPISVNANWPSFASVANGGRGSWIQIPDTSGSYDVRLLGTTPVYDTDGSTWHLYLGRPVDVALRGARRLVVPVVTAGTLSGAGTAMVLYRFWS